MTAATLIPMVEGGKWLRVDDSRPPMYVAHEAHIKRLLMEGAQVVDDPRPALLAKGLLKPHVPAHEQLSETETALRAEIDQLKAMLSQLMNAKPEEAKGKK